MHYVQMRLYLDGYMIFITKSISKLEFMNQNGYTATVKIMGIPDRLVEHGSPRELYNEIGLNAQGVAEVLRGWMKEMGKVATQVQ